MQNFILTDYCYYYYSNTEKFYNFNCEEQLNSVNGRSNKW